MAKYLNFHNRNNLTELGVKAGDGKVLGNGSMHARNDESMKERPGTVIQDHAQVSSLEQAGRVGFSDQIFAWVVENKLQTSFAAPGDQRYETPLLVEHEIPGSVVGISARPSSPQAPHASTRATSSTISRSRPSARVDHPPIPLLRY